MSEVVAQRLLAKYVEILRLRREHADGTERDPRPALRLLAGEFPGALRELDTMPLDEVERRVAHLANVVAGGAAEEWVSPQARYHQVLRAALAERVSGTPAGALAGHRGRLSGFAIATLAAETGLSEPRLRELLFSVRNR